MQQEDKELEGPELEREQRLEEEAVPREQTELPVLAGEEVRDIELLHRGRLFDAMQAMLAENEIQIGMLYLPQRETEALEFLQTAIRGRDALGQFVFAEDRASLLEQALAVLQENITHGEAEQIAELETKFSAMTEQVATLREQLTNLGDAQDEEELILHRDHKAETDEPETPEAKPPEEIEPLADYLRAPELPERPAHVSQLDGPEPSRAAPTSTLADGGPEAPKLPDHVSTLGD